MSELDKLKKENKQLKALLRNAVELLDRYKDVLKHPEKLGDKKKKKKEKKGKKNEKSANKKKREEGKEEIGREAEAGAANRTKRGGPPLGRALRHHGNAATSAADPCAVPQVRVLRQQASPGAQPSISFGQSMTLSETPAAFRSTHSILPGEGTHGWTRLDGVDVLRGLAIFFVLMNHVNMRLFLAKIPYTAGPSSPMGVLPGLEWAVRRTDVLRGLRLSDYVDLASALGVAGQGERARLLRAALCAHRAVAPFAAGRSQRSSRPWDSRISSSRRKPEDWVGRSSPRSPFTSISWRHVADTCRGIGTFCGRCRSRKCSIFSSRSSAGCWDAASG